MCKSDTIQAEKPVQAEEKTNEMFKTYFDRITDPGSNDPMLPTNTCLCIQVSKLVLKIFQFFKLLPDFQYKNLDTLEMFGPFGSVWCKMALGEVDVSLP